MLCYQMEKMYHLQVQHHQLCLQPFWGQFASSSHGWVVHFPCLAWDYSNNTKQISIFISRTRKQKQPNLLDSYHNTHRLTSRWLCFKIWVTLATKTALLLTCLTHNHANLASPICCSVGVFSVMVMKSIPSGLISSAYWSSQPPPTCHNECFPFSCFFASRILKVFDFPFRICKPFCLYLGATTI